MRRADSSSVRVHDLSYQKRNHLSLKTEVVHEVVIYLLELRRPAWIACVRLTLVYEHALDDSVFLSELRHLDKSGIRIIVICGKHALHPARSTFLHIAGDAVRKECLDMASSDGHIDDTDPYIFRKSLDKSPSEVVCRSESCVRTAERRYCSVPFSLFATSFLVVDCRHHHESVADTFKILLLYAGISLHVRLAEAQIDMEIRILGIDSHGAQQREG